MSPRFQRLVHFAANTVKIEYEDPRAGRLLDYLVRTFTSPGAEKPFVDFFIEVSADPATLYSLYQNGQKIFTSASQPDTAEMLLSRICHELAVDSRDGLLFHAAGLSWRGQGLLVPGGIGYGKSTFTTWLVARGCDYLSDELVYLPFGQRQMISFARPLHLKKPSRPVLRPWIDFDTPNEDILVGANSDLVQPEVLKADNVYSQPEAQIVLFPRYSAAGNFSWQPLSPAQTGLELLACLINARNLPDHGFLEATRLALSVRGFKLTYSRFDEVEAFIDNLLQAL